MKPETGEGVEPVLADFSLSLATRIATRKFTRSVAAFMGLIVILMPRVEAAEEHNNDPLPVLSGNTTLQPSDLRCEYSQDPIGVDAVQPQLSWALHSHGRNKKQSAYHLLVATRPALLDANVGDLWDSGQVASDESVHVLYQGKALSSRLRCYWKVQVWDEAGRFRPGANARPGRWGCFVQRIGKGGG